MTLNESIIAVVILLLLAVAVYPLVAPQSPSIDESQLVEPPVDPIHKPQPVPQPKPIPIPEPNITPPPQPENQTKPADTAASQCPGGVCPTQQSGGLFPRLRARRGR